MSDSDIQWFDLSTIDFSSSDSILAAVYKFNDLAESGIYRPFSGEFLNRIFENIPVSVSGEISFFYSGDGTYRAPQDLARFYPDVFNSLETTPLGLILNNASFQAAIDLSANTQVNGVWAFEFNGLTGPEVLNSYNPGCLWAKASAAYAEVASGDVLVNLGREFDPGKIFAHTELNALLNNADVTSINGIAVADLRAMIGSNGDLTNALNAIQKETHFAIGYALSERFLAGAFGPNADRTFLVDQMKAFGIATDGNEWLAMVDKTIDYAETHNIPMSEFSGVGRTLWFLDKAGTAGDIVEIAIIATDVARMLNNGDVEGAVSVIEDYAAGTAGGIAGSAAGRLVGALILALIPEPSTTIAGLVTIGSIIVGGVIGSNIAEKLVQNLREIAASGEPVTAINLLKDTSLLSVVEQCFTEGTLITMADGTQKPIEEITVKDRVLSFDAASGEMVAGEVVQTFRNEAKIILDFHGTFVTPGHVYYAAGGTFAGTYAPLIDILRDDGAIRLEDGTLIRANTGCEVGSPEDRTFWAFLIETGADGRDRVVDRRELRLGTRFMLPNGEHFSMRDYMEGIGIELMDNGYVRAKADGRVQPFAWVLSDRLPAPEDFILARSATTLEDIYRAGEWESRGSRLDAPLVREGGPVTALSGQAFDQMPRNMPMAKRGLGASSRIGSTRAPAAQQPARVLH